MHHTITQLAVRWRRSFAWANRFAASNTFFYIILGVFAFQALWIVFSGAYSMAYDEYYHLGLIKEYAQQGTPFAQQPPGPAELGSVARDVSFLFHYLMSFPYRLISFFSGSQTVHVIGLRLLCLAFFVGGLLAYRVALLRAGIGKRATHYIMLCFMLLPTVVMVGAQLNYDSLLFLFSGLVFMVATAVVLRLSAKEMPRAASIVGLLTLLLAGSITKYAFLPLALCVGAFVCVQMFLARRSIDWAHFGADVRAFVRRPLGWVLMACFLLVSVMFVQRVGVNVIRYHTPVPDCGQVLSVEQCMGHDPYERNQKYKDAKFADYVTMTNKLTYPVRWYMQMVRESFFVVGPREARYATGNPLPLAYWAAMIILPVMCVAVLLRFKMLWRHSAAMRLFMIAVVGYTAVLFFRNLADYLHLGVPVAIHGRYIIYVIPLFAALAVTSLRSLVPHRMRHHMIAVALVAVVMLVLGGGWLPFIIHSADTWLWQWAVEPTRMLRSLLWPFIIK